MKKITVLLGIYLFGLVSCNSQVNTNTTLKFTYNPETMTASIVATPDFNGEKLTVPNYITVEEKQYKVTAIGKDAFEGNNYIKEVIFGDYVNVVSWDAFLNCKNLQSVDLKNVTVIGDNAFNSCTNLKNIKGGENLKTLYKGVFASTNITIIDFPNLEASGIDCFWNNPSLSIANIGKIKTLPGSSFERCTSLTSINAPYLEIVDNYAFKNCYKLRDISFENIHTIGISAFESTSIESLNLKDVDIYHSAFLNCKKLTSVNIDTKILNYKTFANCSSLNTINLSNIESIGSNCFANVNIPSLTIPSSVKEIKSEAFASCNIKELQFAENSQIEYINRRAFYNNKIEGEISIPSTCKKIYTQAFKNNRITSVNIDTSTIYEDDSFDTSTKINQ